MPEGDVERVLGSDEYGGLVDREVREAQGEAVSGVPHFVVNDMFEVGGAQEAAAFVQVFERVKKLEAERDGQ